MPKRKEHKCLNNIREYNLRGELLTGTIVCTPENAPDMFAGLALLYAPRNERNWKIIQREQKRQQLLSELIELDRK